MHRYSWPHTHLGTGGAHHIYLHHQKVDGMFSPLFVCLWAGYLKTLKTDLDEPWWTRWLCDKEELIRFWWRSESGNEKFLKLLQWFFTIERWGQKIKHSMMFQKVVDRLWQNLMDELDRWQEQADSILVQIRMQIRPMSELQNVNCSTWWRYALYRVPF